MTGRISSYQTGRGGMGMVGLARAVDHRLLREGRYSQLQYVL